MSTIYVEGGAGQLPNDFVDPGTNTTFSYDPSASVAGTYAYTDPATDYGYVGTDLSGGAGTASDPYAWTPDPGAYDSSSADYSAGTDYSASSDYSAAPSTDYSSADYSSSSTDYSAGTGSSGDYSASSSTDYSASTDSSGV